MIGRLQGTLHELTPERVVLDVGGVGYDVHISLQTFYALAGQQERPVHLAIHTHVRDDVLALYGFGDPDERELFRALIAVSGIGPRVALAILSGLPAAEFRRVVAEGDRARLQKVPGVGKKTAERVLLELGDRMRKLAAAGAGDEVPAARRGDASGGDGSPVRSDAISALLNLGYPDDRARRAVDAAMTDPGGSGDERALEDVLRDALRHLAR